MDCPNVRKLDIVEVMETCDTVCDFYCKYKEEEDYCRYCPVKSVRERYL